MGLRSTSRVHPGRPFPLGATWDGAGVNFALFSEHATAVDLCLFDSVTSEAEQDRIRLTEREGGVWHCYLPDVRPGQLYGYRVSGPHDPAGGHRFNPTKVLLDPYARAVERANVWNDSLLGYRPDHPDLDLSYSDADSAASAPLAVVVDPAFTWGPDRLLGTPRSETVIYELHVGGFTRLHPDVPERLRGTYAGLASAPVVRYLKDLGVTAVELMPVHQHMDERSVIERGLKNYWGYNTLSYFAPDARYATTGRGVDAVDEFKVMVRTLHAAGIEVILDVVYNHTSEGDERGPTISLRGIDNASFYRLRPDNRRAYMDFTGTGNTMNMQHPRALQLVMDSLRYWVLDMHVDGFRFDLASALARELYDVDRLSSFFDIIGQDPVLSRVKLIAEPWDLGEGGYQVGNFPPEWAEWNGKYRDTVRRFWRGDGGQVPEMATRLAGSSDLYAVNGRRPFASINFVTAHDGFTLRDLVSYDRKHNEANGEENRDGSDENLSWNCGVEGETAEPAVLDIRRRQMRNFIATLFLSQGVPMLLAGDEFGRTQRGNNNAYCQDNEVSWTDWRLEHWQEELLRFTRTMIRLRTDHPVLRQRRFLENRNGGSTEQHPALWLLPEGGEIDGELWGDQSRRAFGLLLNGDALARPAGDGSSHSATTLLVLLNASDASVDFVLPARRRGSRWHRLVDTAEGSAPRRADLDPYPLQPRSLAVLRLGRRKG
ncbi:MAG: glycogen debranching protein GlgX [Dehalococcoidia bacterium]